MNVASIGAKRVTPVFVDFTTCDLVSKAFVTAMVPCSTSTSAQSSARSSPGRRPAYAAIA
jgi:hypothetical protein